MGSDIDIGSWLMGRKGELDDIISGKTKSWRHDIYVNGPPKCRAELKHNLWNLQLNKWAVEEIPMQLLKMYCKKDMKMFTYIWDVLVPEVVIRLLMEVNCIEYSEAEVLMSSLPQEMKNAESESSDADDFFVSLPTKRKKQEEQEEPSDLLARSRSIAKGKRATLNKNRRDAVMVTVCGMEPSKKRKGRYESFTDFSEIEVSRRDVYDTLANKAAFAVGLLDDNESSISLFKPVAGSRIVNEDISLRDGQMVPWTIGAYLNRARKSAESMSFGVGFLHLKAPVPRTSTTNRSGLQPKRAPGSLTATEFSLEELEGATESFKTVIGEGAFGTVFLGHNIRNSATSVAVKVLNEIYLPSLSSFSILEEVTMVGEKAIQDKVTQLHAEITALTKFRHPNLVELMGFHRSDSKIALVYEYLEEGSLYHHLHDSSVEALSWDKRSHILKGTLRALTYLHGGIPPLVHQDIKSLNILLDTSLTAKLGDFGFAMDMPEHRSGRTLVSAPLIARSDGYFAPELIGRKISPKSDVYSFGVVVLETFCGMKAYDSKRDDPELALHCQDALSDSGPTTFKEFADDRIGPPDLNLLTLLHNVAKNATKRHSIRSTAAELMEKFEEYSE